MKKTSIVLMTLTALLMPLPLLAQSVRELIPPSAPAGARVMVSGRGLADPSIAVAFGSVSASVVERNDRYIEVVVPSAATTGNVRVTLGATLIKELPFTLANAPAYTVTTLAGGPPSKNVVLKHPWAATVIRWAPSERALMLGRGGRGSARSSFMGMRWIIATRRKR